MKVDLPASDIMKDVRAQVRAELETRINPVPEFRLHPSLTFGLNEITRGLARLFPHRRSIAYIQGCGPYFDPLVTYFSGEGYALQVFPFQALKNIDWVETLKKDTLMVLFSEDDPLTGQLFDVEGFQKVLEQKRIFTVSVSHTAHLFRPTWKIAPYWARVLSGGGRFSLSLLGERSAKVETLLHGPADWAMALREAIPQVFTLKAEDSQTVEELEGQDCGGAKALFPKGTARVFDRAAIYWDDMDGEAFIHQLASQLVVDLLIPGTDNPLETASLCRWKGLRTLNWLSEQGISPEVSRGLVLISKDLINKKLPDQIKKAREAILKLQNGE